MTLLLGLTTATGATAQDSSNGMDSDAVSGAQKPPVFIYKIEQHLGKKIKLLLETGEGETIELMMGYNDDNKSALNSFVNKYSRIVGGGGKAGTKSNWFP